MPTSKQVLGSWGEEQVATKCSCPKCKRTKTLRRLPKNFKCADVICDFCGFLGQVKTMSKSNPALLPDEILGAAWEPQRLRMASSIFFPLFLVLKDARAYAIYYLPADLQSRALFSPRKPLSSTARRAGWRGFKYKLAAVPKGAFVRLLYVDWGVKPGPSKAT